MSYFIGLLMVADEDDIIDRTLEINRELVDCFYVLDGSRDQSPSLFLDDAKCWGYTHDDVLSAEYGDKPVDGWRHYLHTQAVEDHGADNWFLLLHGDEIWTKHPAHIVGREDGYVFQLPFFFPREGEPWDDSKHPVDQLAWSLGPGYPEFRMFKGAPHVAYNKRQHFNVAPAGLANVGFCGETILHYPYRSPEVQRARAARHEETGFDPDNYRHILDGDSVYWTDDMIGAYRAKPWFRDLNCNTIGVR